MNAISKLGQQCTHLPFMKYLYFTLVLALIAVTVCGCATDQPSSQNTNPTTVSGYVDVGTGTHIK